MSKVNVKINQATVGAQRNDVDVAAVMASVVRIWAAARVELVLDPAVRTMELADVPAGLNGVEAEALMLPELATHLKDPGDHIEVVFLPVLGAWGKSFTPLTPASANKEGTFAPFAGPVAIVTTGDSLDASKKRAARSAQAWPLVDAPQTNPLIAQAVANDLAHEIGHLFGLWHPGARNRPGRATFKGNQPEIQYLMHDTMYTQFTGLRHVAANRERTEDEARGMMARGTENVTLARNDQWYMALRGEEIHPEDAALVHTNITDGRHLRG